MDKTEKAALASVCVNIFLSFFKFILGYFSGSIALFADALHSFVDIIASGIVYLGLKVARSKSVKFPYGLYKVENLASLIIALVIFGTGYEILKVVLSLSGAESELRNIPVTLGGMLVTIFLTFGIGYYQVKVGKSTGSPSIVADGCHSLVEVSASVAVLFGLAASLFGLKIDQLAVLVVVLFFFKSGFEVMTDALKHEYKLELIQWDEVSGPITASDVDNKRV